MRRFFWKIRSVTFFREREEVPVPLGRHAKRARIPVASATDLRIAAWSSRRRAESNGLLRLLFYFSAQSFSLQRRSVEWNPYMASACKNALSLTMLFVFFPCITWLCFFSFDSIRESTDQDWTIFAYKTCFLLVFLTIFVLYFLTISWGVIWL